MAVIGSNLYVVFALLQLRDSVPPLQPGLGGTRTRGGSDLQHFLELTGFFCLFCFGFFCRVKFCDPQYPDGFVFKATLLPRAK